MIVDNRLTQDGTGSNENLCNCEQIRIIKTHQVLPKDALLKFCFSVIHPSIVNDLVCGVRAVIPILSTPIDLSH